jgi:hypothetical protein
MPVGYQYVCKASPPHSQAAHHMHCTTGASWRIVHKCRQAVTLYRLPWQCTTESIGHRHKISKSMPLALPHCTC